MSEASVSTSEVDSDDSGDSPVFNYTYAMTAPIVPSIAADLSCFENRKRKDSKEHEQSDQTLHDSSHPTVLNSDEGSNPTALEHLEPYLPNNSNPCTRSRSNKQAPTTKTKHPVFESPILRTSSKFLGPEPNATESLHHRLPTEIWFLILGQMPDQPALYALLEAYPSLKPLWRNRYTEIHEGIYQKAGYTKGNGGEGLKRYLRLVENQHK
ncbi:MAG: hypothetical protein Q9169_006852 [Polycauliona sp. 2 TL-2023]